MAWELETKTDESEDWDAIAKIPQEGETLYILTPDGSFILVGQNEDETLVYQEEFDNWDLKTKVESE